MWHGESSVEPKIKPQREYGEPQIRTREQALMAAVLEDAVAVVEGRPVRRIEIARTWAWLWDDDRTWPYSFTNLCDAVHLDASAVRRRLRPGYLRWLATGERIVVARRRYREVAGNHTKIGG